MAKLEDISRKNIFNVPDDYFDKLPAQIQSRIPTTATKNNSRPVHIYALRYALPIVIVAAGFFFYNQNNTSDPESMLASVATSDLVIFLEESDFTSEDLFETADFSQEELEAIENEVYGLNVDNLDPDDLPVELNLNTR